MIECEMKDLLRMCPRTSIDLGLRNIPSNPTITVVMSRKAIEDGRMWKFTLEQDLGKLPQEFIEFIEGEKLKKDLFTFGESKGVEDQVLRSLKKSYRLTAQEPKTGNVVITACSQKYKNFRIFLRPKDAKMFFKNI